MVYSSWDIVHDRCNCYFSFWVISPFYPPKSQKNSKFSKNEKNSCRYHHFTYVYQKLWSNHLRFLRYAVQQTDRWTDRKSDTKRWVPHVRIRTASYIDPKGYLFSTKKKKRPKNLTTPYSNQFLSALYQNKALYNFQKRGQGSKAWCCFCLD